MIALVPIVPRILKLRSPEELEREIAARKKAEEALLRANVDLEAQVQCRTAEIQERNNELRRSNRELDDFAYITAHDLKEPLRGMHNYATFLLEDYGAKLDSEGAAKLETLKVLTERMVALLDSLLDIAHVGRIGSGIKETDPQYPFERGARFLSDDFRRVGR